MDFGDPSTTVLVNDVCGSVRALLGRDPGNQKAQSSTSNKKKRRLRVAYLVVWSPQRSAAGGRTLVAARQACDFCPRATEMKRPKPESGSASASEQSISGPFFRVIEAFVSTAVRGRCSTLNLGDKHSIVKGEQRRGLLFFFFVCLFCTWGGSFVVQYEGIVCESCCYSWIEARLVDCRPGWSKSPLIRTEVKGAKER